MRNPTVSQIGRALQAFDAKCEEESRKRDEKQIERISATCRRFENAKPAPKFLSKLAEDYCRDCSLLLREIFRLRGKK